MLDFGVNMEKFFIAGGKKLEGSVVVDTAKNAILPIIAATLLTEEEVILHNVPKIVDVYKMLDIITSMGGCVKWLDEKTLSIKNDNITNLKISGEKTSDIRSSIFILGPMLSKFRKACVAYPGGCDIGSRPIDLHLFGLRELNVKIVEEYGFINCDGRDMSPRLIHLDFPSVGATENLMMAAVLLKGETILHNCAKEPEIVDLANFINEMGGQIYGAGDSVIRVVGVKTLKGTEYTPIGDRIVAGTLMIATALTKGRIELANINYEFVLSLINKLRKTGCNIEFFSDRIILDSKSRPNCCSFDTQPYPGFPTDLQPQLSVLLSIARGTSIVTENLFETRFKHFSELTKMGAKIISRDRTAIVKGVPRLYGASVNAYDLRGGAALVLAGLCAKGITEVNNVSYIDRGYSNFEQTLNSLGADIKRIK